MKAFKKVLAYALAATLALGSCTTAFAATSSPVTGKDPVKQDTTVSTGGNKLDVDTTKGGNAGISSIKSNKTSVSVPKTVTVNGVKYTVRVIRANTFAKATKATKVSIPASVKSIQKNAFKGAKNLKTVRLNISKANQIKVNKGAFKGLKTAKMTIKVNKNMSKKALNNLKRALKKAGFKGKVVRVK